MGQPRQESGLHGVLRPTHGRHCTLADPARRRHRRGAEASPTARVGAEGLRQRRGSRKSRLSRMEERRTDTGGCRLCGRIALQRLGRHLGTPRLAHSGALYQGDAGSAPLRPALHQLAALRRHGGMLHCQSRRRCRLVQDQDGHEQGRGMVHRRRPLQRRPLLRLRLLQRLRHTAHVHRVPADDTPGARQQLPGPCRTATTATALRTV